MKTLPDTNKDMLDRMTAVMREGYSITLYGFGPFFCELSQIIVPEDNSIRRRVFNTQAKESIVSAIEEALSVAEERIMDQDEDQ